MLPPTRMMGIPQEPGDRIYTRPSIPSLYLAHPYVAKEKGAALQAKLEAKGYFVFNPFDRPEQPHYDNVLASKGELTADECRSIVRNDLLQIQAADFTVAYIPNVLTIGTCMEVYHTSSVCHKPVYVLTESFGLNHPWLVIFSKVLTNNEDELFAQLPEIPGAAV